MRIRQDHISLKLQNLRFPEHRILKTVFGCCEDSIFFSLALLILDRARVINDAFMISGPSMLPTSFQREVSEIFMSSFTIDAYSRN